MSEKKPKYTPDQIAESEKSRTFSDTELLRGGARYTVNENGEKDNLLATQDQKEMILKHERGKTEYLGDFSDNSLHYYFEAGHGSKIEDLSEEIEVGKNIARSMSYDRGKDVNAIIKMIPGKVWMEVSLTDDPSRVVTNITANKKGNEWFVGHHIHIPKEITLRRYIESYPLYTEL